MAEEETKDDFVSPRPQLIELAAVYVKDNPLPLKPQRQLAWLADFALLPEVHDLICTPQ